MFHRSVGMDAWSPDQLKKMQLGGNDKLNAFLETYGVQKHTDIKEKYNSKAAEVRLAQASPITMVFKGSLHLGYRVWYVNSMLTEVEQSRYGVYYSIVFMFSCVICISTWNLSWYVET